MVGSEISRFSIQELQKNVDVVFEDLKAVMLYGEWVFVFMASGLVMN